MKTKDEIISELDQFTGTEHYYRLNPSLMMTDGVKHMVDECRTYWLMDVIWSHLPGVPADEHFLVAKLVVKGIQGVFTLADDVPPQNYSTEQEIGFTTFPLDAITLYATRVDHLWVVMLPSEY